MEPDATFGQELAKLLDSLGWSQSELRKRLALADRAVAASTVSSWVVGARVPSVGVLGDVLDVLAVQGSARLRLYRLAEQVGESDR